MKNSISLFAWESVSLRVSATAHETPKLLIVSQLPLDCTNRFNLMLAHYANVAEELAGPELYIANSNHMHDYIMDIQRFK